MSVVVGGVGASSRVVVVAVAMFGTLGATSVICAIRRFVVGIVGITAKGYI